MFLDKCNETQKNATLVPIPFIISLAIRLVTYRKFKSSFHKHTQRYYLLDKQMTHFSHEVINILKI